MSDPRQITIRRGRAFFGMLRKLVINVDGVEVLRIGRGESLPLTLPAGAKSLEVCLGRNAAPPFDLAEIENGDTLAINVKNRSYKELREAKELPFVISVEKSS